MCSPLIAEAGHVPGSCSRTSTAGRDSFSFSNCQEVFPNRARYGSCVVVVLIPAFAIQEHGGGGGVPPPPNLTQAQDRLARLDSGEGGRGGGPLSLAPCYGNCSYDGALLLVLSTN